VYRQCLLKKLDVLKDSADVKQKPCCALRIMLVIRQPDWKWLLCWLSSAQQIQPIPPTNKDQGDNADNDNNFVSHDFTSSFDNLVVWLSPNILFNRMVMAGKLP